MRREMVGKSLRRAIHELGEDTSGGTEVKRRWGKKRVEEEVNRRKLWRRRL